MNELQFTLLKEEFIEGIKRHITEEGELHPHITIFAEVNKDSEIVKDLDDESKPAIIHIPIPSEYMRSEEGKEEFVRDVFPNIAKKIKKDFTPSAVAWVTEAWMRVIKKADASSVKKEVLFITIESAFGEYCNVYDINRSGKQITENGELVDKIELVLSHDVSAQEARLGGRFTGLFSKFKD